MENAAKLDALGTGYARSSHRSMLIQNRRKRRKGRKEKLASRRTHRLSISRNGKELIELASKIGDGDGLQTSHTDHTDENVEIVVELSDLNMTSYKSKNKSEVGIEGK